MYDHPVRDAFWQSQWSSNPSPQNESGEKYYILEMFPYTSGKLHIGHARNYSMGDTLARMQRARQYRVLYPMGWDAFGLPAENAAIKFGTHPARFTMDAIDKMKAAMGRLGLSYDWEREVTTCSPDYMRAQQQLFIELYHRGIVQRAESYQYWDPVEQTVLANEQVIDGKGWRSGATVEKRKTMQWFFDIRSYADELYDGLDGLAEWPEAVRNIQRNWIGRSDGVELVFRSGEQPLTAFSTRCDTVAGCTFLAVAPEHPAVDWLARGQNERDVLAFRDHVLLETTEQRFTADVDGIATGKFATNPVTGEVVPIFIANYVSFDFGTGVVMGVPGHSERDFAFARKFDLPIRFVVEPIDGSAVPGDEAFEQDGSVSILGEPAQSSMAARVSVAGFLESQRLGGPARHYRLQNWSISRQRYWGCPIPIIHCSSCGPQPVPTESLPVKLPEDVNLSGGGSPLSRNTDWLSTSCPACGGGGTRDPDTMDTFVDSSWYFFRYLSPQFHGAPVSRKDVDSNMPADVYIGGVEHATLHLIYARFMTRVLRDLGYTTVSEPFVRLFNQGMVNDSFGRKQSKSVGNVVDPIDVVERYGADALRVYLLFKTRYSASINWEDNGPAAALAFLNRVLRLVDQHAGMARRHADITSCDLNSDDGPRAIALMQAVHRTINKVTGDVLRFSFNSAIAAMMKLTNTLSAADPGDVGEVVYVGALRTLIRLLAIVAPHMAEEMWHRSGRSDLAADQPWNAVDPKALEQSVLSLPIQINGRLVSTVLVDRDVNEDDVLELAVSQEDVRRRLTGRTLKGHKYVEARILNLVVE